MVGVTTRRTIPFRVPATDRRVVRGVSPAHAGGPQPGTGQPAQALTPLRHTQAGTACDYGSVRWDPPHRPGGILSGPVGSRAPPPERSYHRGQAIECQTVMGNAHGAERPPPVGGIVHRSAIPSPEEDGGGRRVDAVPRDLGFMTGQRASPGRAKSSGTGRIDPSGTTLAVVRGHARCAHVRATSSRNPGAPHVRSVRAKNMDKIRDHNLFLLLLLYSVWGGRENYEEGVPAPVLSKALGPRHRPRMRTGAMPGDHRSDLEGPAPSRIPLETPGALTLGGCPGDDCDRGQYPEPRRGTPDLPGEESRAGQRVSGTENQECPERLQHGPAGDGVR